MEKKTKNVETQKEKTALVDEQWLESQLWSMKAQKISSLDPGVCH